MFLRYEHDQARTGQYGRASSLFLSSMIELTSLSTLKARPLWRSSHSAGLRAAHNAQAVAATGVHPPSTPHRSEQVCGSRSAFAAANHKVTTRPCLYKDRMLDATRDIVSLLLQARWLRECQRVGGLTTAHHPGSAKTAVCRWRSLRLSSGHLAGYSGTGARSPLLLRERRSCNSGPSVLSSTVTRSLACAPSLTFRQRNVY